MAENILIYAGPLVEATDKNEVQWYLIENTTCLTVYFNDNHFILCRYTFEDSQKSVISFNYLDTENLDTEDTFFQWGEETAEYKQLDDLYNAAHAKSLVSPQFELEVD